MFVCFFILFLNYAVLENSALSPVFTVQCTNPKFWICIKADTVGRAQKLGCDVFTAGRPNPQLGVDLKQGTYFVFDQLQSHL